MAVAQLTTETLCALRSNLISFAQEGANSLSGFSSGYQALMSSFEPKRRQLEMDVHNAARSLSVCESWRGSNGESRNCDSEERQYARAISRLRRLEALIDEARTLIAEYESEDQKYRQQLSQVQERYVPYLDNIISILDSYLDVEDFQVTSSPLIPDTGKGSDTVPSDAAITSDAEASADSPDNSFVSYEIPQSEYRIAAAGILSVAAVGGASASIPMLIRSRANQMFYDKYGMTEIQALAKANGETTPAVEEYNRIVRELETAVANAK